MKSYLRATDREDDKTAAAIREKHEGELRVIDEALEFVLRGLADDFGGRDKKLTNSEFDSRQAHCEGQHRQPRTETSRSRIWIGFGLKL